MSQTNQENIKEIQRLQRALVRYSEKLNNKHYEDKTPLEREIDNISASLLMHLEKLKNRIEKGQPEPEATPMEQLASKMQRVATALHTGQIPDIVANQVVSEFDKALEFFDLAHAAKNAGKTALAKDKLKGLGG